MPWFADNFWTQELEQAVTHRIDQTKINRTADRVCGDRGSFEKCIRIHFSVLADPLYMLGE